MHARELLNSLLLGALDVHDFASQDTAKSGCNLHDTLRFCDKASGWTRKWVTHLIVRQKLRTQDPIVGIMWLHICERMESDVGNIRSADKWDLAISTSSIDLTLVFDGDLMRIIREVF